MRKFNVRVQSCNVISDGDADFGRVLVPNTGPTNVLPSTLVEQEKINHLSNEQQTELLALVDEFHMCFSDKPGLCNAAEHRIRVTPEFQPKRMRPYRVPEAMKPEVERQIAVLLEAGLIVRSDSPMASPLVCVAKKQGMISVFDAKSGYWQFLVHSEDRWLTAFVTHEGLYEWERMPFGLRNAGATFIRALTSILQPVQQFAGSYVDDMAVGSGDWTSHMTHLRRFLVTIQDAGITLSIAC